MASRVNHNTTALLNALQCDLFTLRKQAIKLIRKAAKDYPTRRAAAEYLGTNERSFRRMLALIDD